MERGFFLLAIIAAALFSVYSHATTATDILQLLPECFCNISRKITSAIRGLRNGRANFEVEKWISSFVRPCSSLIKGRRPWPGRCIGLREAPRIAGAALGGGGSRGSDPPASGVARILCQGAQAWRREKTKNNKCMSYHPRQHSLYS